MIYCGDFTFPSQFSKYIFEGLGNNFIQKPKIVNFESTLSHLNKRRITKGIALESSLDSKTALNYLNVKCTGHANNHVLDFDFNLHTYQKYFKKAKIQPIGLGINLEEATRPFFFDEEKLIVIAFGWKTIRCTPAGQNKRGVSPYKYSFVDKLVKHYRDIYPDHRIILYPHWNYEFETCPFPADRKFSHHLIDLGVDGIFGHHPHVINCFEIYKGKPIFYSLGNFYFPQVRYGDNVINFRKSALNGISIEYDGALEDLKIHHHCQTKKGEKIKLIGSYGLDEISKSEIPLLENISEFSDEKYYHFYKKNRFHKMKGLPIYRDYKNNFQNELYSLYVQLRQIPVDFLSKKR